MTREERQPDTSVAGARDPAVLAWYRLVRVFDKIHHGSVGLLAQYGLTPAQLNVLAQLSRHGAMSQQELAGRLLVSKGNVCGLIDRLERRGLVERCADRQDRRINMLHLSEAGRQLATLAVPAHEEFVRRQLSSLSRSEQQELLALLSKLDRSLPSR
jgi:DNA-binding MarR family transcriptional regulator